MAAQMLLRYSQSPQVHALQLKNVMNIWQKPILRKALTSFCILSEKCPSSVFSSNHK